MDMDLEQHNNLPHFEEVKTQRIAYNFFTDPPVLSVSGLGATSIQDPNKMLEELVFL